MNKLKSVGQPADFFFSKMVNKQSKYSPPYQRLTYIQTYDIMKIIILGMEI